jgi:hypothetical protein
MSETRKQRVIERYGYGMLDFDMLVSSIERTLVGTRNTEQVREFEETALNGPPSLFQKSEAMPVVEVRYARILDLS